jgi:hypothetical protein
MPILGDLFWLAMFAVIFSAVFIAASLAIHGRVNW